MLKKSFISIVVVLISLLIINSLDFETSQKNQVSKTSASPNEPDTLDSISELSIQLDSTDTQISDTTSVRCLPQVEEPGIDELQLLNKRVLHSEAFEFQQVSALVGLEEMINPQNYSDNKHNKRINKLSALLEIHPENKLISYHLMAVCSENPENANCSVEKISQAIALDSANGALWGKIAAIYIVQENYIAAQNAFKQSASTPTFDDYRVERLSLFRETILQAGVRSGTALLTALSYEAAMPFFGINKVFDYCTDFSLSQADIAQACLAYGKRMEEDGNSFLTIAFGLTTQRLVFESLRDEGSTLKVNLRYKAANEQFRENHFKHIALLKYDQSYQDYWFLTMSNYNEIAALKLQNTEAERLLSDADYKFCSDN